MRNGASESFDSSVFSSDNSEDVKQNEQYDYIWGKEDYFLSDSDGRSFTEPPIVPEVPVATLPIAPEAPVATPSIVPQEPEFCILNSIKCGKGTEGEKWTLDRLYSYIVSGVRVDTEPMKKEERDCYKETLKVLSSPMAKTIRRGIYKGAKGICEGAKDKNSKPLSSGYIHFDIDHIGYRNAERLRDYIAKCPACVFVALSATDGIWGLLRGDCTTFGKTRLTNIVREIFTKCVPPEEAELQERMYDAIDEHAFDIDQQRFLAFDPEAKRGPSYDAGSFFLSEIDMESSLHRLSEEARLYSIATRFAHPSVAHSPDFVYRSNAMGAAMVAMSLSCPSMCKGTDFIPQCLVAVESGIGKSFCVESLRGIAHRLDIGGTAINLKTAEGAQDGIRDFLTEEADDTTKSNSHCDLMQREDIPPVLLVNDEYGNNRRNGNTQGYSAGLDGFTNDFCTGRVNFGQSRNTRKGGVVRNGMLHVVGGVYLCGTPESVASACLNDDQTDGRNRRTLPFCPEKLSPAAIARLRNYRDNTKAKENREAINKEMDRIRKAYEDYCIAKGRKAVAHVDFSTNEITKHEFICSEEADLLRTVYLAGRGIDEAQWVDETVQAVAIADCNFDVITEDEMLYALVIVDGMKKSIGRRSSCIVLQDSTPRGQWIEGNRKSVEGQFIRYPDGVPYANVNNLRSLENCPMLNGRKANAFLLWELGIICPTPETMNGKKMDTKWVMIKSMESPVKIEDSIWKKEMKLSSDTGTTAFSGNEASGRNDDVSYASGVEAKGRSGRWIGETGRKGAMSKEKRLDKWAESAKEKLVSEMRAVPEGYRHDECYNKCLSMRSVGMGAGWSDSMIRDALMGIADASVGVGEGSGERQDRIRAVEDAMKNPDVKPRYPKDF